MLTPRKPAPELNVPTLAHGVFDLHSETPQNFSLIVFFRGLHCPLCIKYLKEPVWLSTPVICCKRVGSIHF